MERPDAFGNVLAPGSRSDPISRTTTVGSGLCVSVHWGDDSKHRYIHCSLCRSLLLPMFFQDGPGSIKRRSNQSETVNSTSIISLNSIAKKTPAIATSRHLLKVSSIHSIQPNHRKYWLVRQRCIRRSRSPLYFLALGRSTSLFVRPHHLERAPGLALFSERIYFHIQLNYPWYRILNYIIVFFRAYQNSAPDVWNDVDGVLVANNLAVAQQRPALENTSKSSKENTVSISIVDISLNQQICRNWNRMDFGCKKSDCPRRHICSICDQDGHRAFQCPSIKT